MDTVVVLVIAVILVVGGIIWKVNIKTWVLITLFLYLVAGVWANLGTTQGIYNLSNLSASLAFIA